MRQKRTSEGNEMQHIGVFLLPGYVVAILVIATVVGYGGAFALSKLSFHNTALAFAGIGAVTNLILLVTLWSLPGLFGDDFYILGFVAAMASLWSVVISVLIYWEVVEKHPNYRK